MLSEVQAYWGAQNTIEEVFFSDPSEAVLFVRASDSSNPIMVNLTNLAEWHAGGTLTLDEVRDQIKGPDRTVVRRSLVTIMLPLLDEAIAVWRPVQAEVLSRGRYRIVSENPDPEDEHWAFAAGTLVLCEERSFEGENYLVAVSLAA